MLECIRCVFEKNICLISSEKSDAPAQFEYHTVIEKV